MILLPYLLHADLLQVPVDPFYAGLHHNLSSHVTNTEMMSYILVGFSFLRSNHYRTGVHPIVVKIVDKAVGYITTNAEADIIQILVE